MEGVGKGTLAPFEFPFLSLWGKRGTPRKNDLQKIENKFPPEAREHGSYTSPVDLGEFHQASMRLLHLTRELRIISSSLNSSAMPTRGNLLFNFLQIIFQPITGREIFGGKNTDNRLVTKNDLQKKSNKFLIVGQFRHFGQFDSVLHFNFCRSFFRPLRQFRR